MRNISSTTVLLTFTIFLLALWITGCGQDGTRVAQLKAEKDKLEEQIAELQAGKVNQPAADENKAQPTSGAADVEFKGKIAQSYEDSVEWWAPKQRPPEGAPNVTIFLLDDTGFVQMGCFGGLINAPNIDKLASKGDLDRVTITLTD